MFAGCQGVKILNSPSGWGIPRTLFLPL